MQTFLPFRSFRKSAACLDDKRLGKQRVEALMIVKILSGENDHSVYRNHPAVRMWQGYQDALCYYGLIMCLEWKRRGFEDNLIPEFLARMTTMNFERPVWLSNITYSHRSNLVRKKPEHYRKFFPRIKDDLPYLWPVA